MIGLGFLVGLGRRLVAGPLADAGLWPASYYRHLTLAALEEEDYPRALHYLRWSEEPLLIQILILRLRLLISRHRREHQTIAGLLPQASGDGPRQKYQDLLIQEERALDLLHQYEARALRMLPPPRQAPPT